MANALTDQEKSALLVKVMGWHIEWNKYGLGCVVDSESNPISGVIGELDEDILEHLYDPTNMSLAKRAIRWGYANDAGFAEWLSEKTTALEVLIQEDGMRRALDYLAEPLAIEVDKDES